jgi:hypothetical protein
VRRGREHVEGVSSTVPNSCLCNHHILPGVACSITVILQSTFCQNGFTDLQVASASWNNVNDAEVCKPTNTTCNEETDLLQPGIVHQCMSSSNRSLLHCVLELPDVSMAAVGKLSSARLLLADTNSSCAPCCFERGTWCTEYYAQVPVPLFLSPTYILQLL